MPSNVNTHIQTKLFEIILFEYINFLRKPYEHDQKKRNTILCQSFSKDKVTGHEQWTCNEFEWTRHEQDMNKAIIG